MAGTDPGEQSTPGEAPARRVLERAPSERYEVGSGPTGRPTGERRGATDGPSSRSALTVPLLRALVLAAAGSALLVLISAVLASTVGLLFISGAIGASVGLVLARAAVPTISARSVPMDGARSVPMDGAHTLTRRAVTWLALALTLAAIVAAFVATWLYARSEGGVLGLLDYLWTTFGPFVPAQLLIGSVAAAWGANAGPVQR